LPVALLVIWELTARAAWVDAMFFPPPSEVLRAGARMWRLGELPRHVTATLERMLLGFFVGGGLGILAGIIMGATVGLRRSVEPMVGFFYVLPKISLLPLLMLLFGVGETPRMLLICLAAFLTMVMQTMDAVLQIPKSYLEVARNCGAGGWLLLRRVYLPGALPQVFTGLRQAFGRVLVATISVELVSCPEGVGSMIYMAWQTFSPEKLYLGIALIGTMGVAGNFAMRTAEARLLPWRPAP